ncbi:MAG: ATP phosphoribosyltransferase, partial [Candidatus Daviesbacteria bacterium]|nr:ATP phosphoribosyltransferase [Candidatus Daviesbacteria bacterium]
IKLNVKKNKLQDVLKILPASKTPKISHLVNEDFALESVVFKNQINLLIPQLKNAGAEDILELPISKVVE